MALRAPSREDMTIRKFAPKTQHDLYEGLACQEVFRDQHFFSSYVSRELLRAQFCRPRAKVPLATCEGTGLQGGWDHSTLRLIAASHVVRLHIPPWNR
jgi:hypothetical protein